MVIQYNAAFEKVFKRLNKVGKGVTINGTRLSHLRFVDDIVLFRFSEDPGELEVTVNELMEKGSRNRLEINQGKTELLTNEVDIDLRINLHFLH